jgi:hypothetical protein
VRAASAAAFDTLPQDEANGPHNELENAASARWAPALDTRDDVSAFGGGCAANAPMARRNGVQDNDRFAW